MGLDIFRLLRPKEFLTKLLGSIWELNKMTYIIILNIILVLYMIKCYMYLVTLFQQNHYDLKKGLI